MAWANPFSRSPRLADAGIDPQQMQISGPGVFPAAPPTPEGSTIKDIWSVAGPWGNARDALAAAAAGGAGAGGGAGIPAPGTDIPIPTPRPNPGPSDPGEDRATRFRPDAWTGAVGNTPNPYVVDPMSSPDLAVSPNPFALNSPVNPNAMTGAPTTQGAQAPGGPMPLVPVASYQEAGTAERNIPRKPPEAAKAGRVRKADKKGDRLRPEETGREPSKKRFGY